MYLFSAIQKVSLALLYLLIAFLFLSHEARGEEYRLSIDASRAEQVFARLVRPRLYQDEWLEIVRGLRDETYTIQRGDTLWDISSRQFGDPFLWRKLWHVNNYLTNPHDLGVGQILKYYREGAELNVPTVRVPLVRLTPAGQGSDLDTDLLVSMGIRSRFRPMMIVVREEEVLGEISGAYSVKSYVGELDEIYLDLFNADTVRIGEKFAVVRFDRELQDAGADGVSFNGRLMRLVGEVQAVALGENLVKAEITAQFDLVRRGDQIIDLQKVMEWSAFFNPPDDLTSRVVMGEITERKIYGQGDLVLLNKGEKDGMKPGYLFRVFRDTDPLTQSRWDVEPDFKGEIQVVHADELSSVGYIVRNKTPIFVGDTLVPNQLFADPPPPPRREAQFFEIE